MKVFLLVASYADSIVQFRGPLIDALLAAGVKVHVAAPAVKRNASVYGELTRRGVLVHEFPLARTGMNPLSDARSMIWLFRLMRAIRPEWVLAYTIKPVIYGMLSARAARVPQRHALITGLGYSFQEGPEGGRGRVRWLVQKLYGLALQGAGKVFFQNPDDEALFRSEGILPARARSRVVNGSGICTRSYSVAPLADSPRFLLIARLLGDKGVREYFAAASLIKKRYPQAAFQLVGWIDENPDAISRDELDAWVSSGVVEYLGKLEDVRPAIEACTVYVLPSYREGTPRTVLEAMAMGRPIITTDAPGCRETVINGDSGFLVPVKAVEDLAQAMEQFILDPALARRMGQRSREIAVEKYDVNKVNAVMLEEMGVHV